MRDLLSGKDDQIEMGAAMIAAVSPDILLLTNVDYDAGLVAASAIVDHLAEHGHIMPHVFAWRPNTGMPTEHDIDGNGYISGPKDAQGHGSFAGQAGMLMLSDFPIDIGQSQDFSAFLWRDLPKNASKDTESLADVQRLASVGAWSVTLQSPNTPLTLLAWHAGTPAFDQGTGRNLRRNADENRFWTNFLNGQITEATPHDFVLLGTANLDPSDGLGDRSVIAELLAHPRLQDPAPHSAGASAKSHADKGANLHHLGDPALDTADWRDDPGPGNLRVQYILPAAHLEVTRAGVFWPAPDDPAHEIISNRDPARSWHGVVWVDLAWD